MKVEADRTETIFEDYKEPYTEGQAAIEAARCLYCSDPPCVKACPTHIDIPQFIRKIATNNVRGSARTIFDSNILGMSCARVCPVEVLCVGDCVYNAMGVPPIQIGKLQRHSTDRAFAEGWRFFEAGAPTGKSVGLIGAGPASLAAAHELRRRGHACTIYEKRSVIGGLNTTGVAPYKMRADRSADEVEWILGIGGIEVKTGVEIGKDISLEDLEKQHDAIFIGVGLGPDTRLPVPGEDLAGVHGAVDFIEEMKLGKIGVPGGACAIVGGGNTAIDCVREAMGLGMTATMIYRGVEDKMSGYEHEWIAAKLEGARAEWRALPIAYEGNGRVERVVCQRLGEDKKPIFDADGKPVTFTLPADLVLVAIGQSKLGAMFEKLEGLQLDKGRVVTDEHGFAGRRLAGKAGWYAGGDCRNGGKEVVNAAAEGKTAALAIDAALNGGNHG